MEIKTDISIADLVGLAVALVGLTLGVLNYITELFRRKPRAVVRVSNYMDSAGNVGVAITVANTGEAPFTISGVGFVVAGDKRFYLLHGRGGDSFPKVLHAGETHETVFESWSYAQLAGVKVKCVFARTPIGVEFYSARIGHNRIVGINSTTPNPV